MSAPKLRSTSALSTEAEPLLTAIQTFLTSCRRPAALESGENAIPLTSGCYALEIRSGRLLIEIWAETRSISRRILNLERSATGVLDCSVQKFGGKPGRLTFLDLDRPQSAHRTLCGTRQNFAEQFRRMLLRQFPGWDLPVLSSALHLQHSFSSVFPRAKLIRGNHYIAAMACPGPHEESDLLTFALIWYHHVRCTRRGQGQTSLCLFLPDGAGNLTAHRLRWLNAESLTPRLFRFNEHGSAGEVDPQDLGNLETRVTSAFIPPRLTPEIQALLTTLRGIKGVGCCPELNGAFSIRSRGLEFARIENGRILLGIDSQEAVEECHTEDVTNFAARLSAMATAMPHAATQTAPPTFPERWFESAVRSNLEAIDPHLSPDPVHGQVLTFAAGDRELIDLLAVTYAGRLAVLELKTAEDIQLPLQALDYWMRVAWHSQRGELRHLFPGTSLVEDRPKLFLAAPAMAFHSSNATVLRYFSPEIEVERVGVNSDWQHDLRVVLRLTGAGVPISHGVSE